VKRSSVLFPLLLAWAQGSVVLTASAGHGIWYQPICLGVHFVGDQLGCEVVVGYDDDFGDTTEIMEVYVIVDPLGEATRVPSSGNLAILAVSGNTTAVPGDGGGIRIGPGGSTLSGLPGLPEPGVVAFGGPEYVIQPDDTDPLEVMTVIVWRDLCDDSFPACSSVPSTIQWPVATDIAHPAVALTGVADMAFVCPPGQSVGLSFAVSNEGDIALDNLSVAAAGCEGLAGPLGDANANGLLDPPETWTYTCTRFVSEPITQMAEVTASPVGYADIAVVASAAVTVGLCAADLDCDGAIGLGDILVVIQTWGLCTPGLCAGDLDGDGQVGFGDVLAIIGAWGACD